MMALPRNCFPPQNFQHKEPINMWNRKTEPEPRRLDQPSYSPQPLPQPAAPPPARHPEPVRQTATIGSAVTIKGEIHSCEDIVIDGEIDGSIVSDSRVTVGPNGKVKAHIQAREAEIVGSVRGNVQASDKITIRKTANLVGDIKTAGVVIEDGAYFKGSIDIARKETPKAEPAKSSARPAETPRTATASVAG
jgi:cytoskeletal protein CcmA (bactofilin family)